MLHTRRHPYSNASALDRAAFTLVELLVVIGIIVLLISILLPALKYAWESARAVRCESNLRNICQAMAAYAVENKGSIPAAPASATDYFPGPKALIYYFDKTKRGMIEFDNGVVMKYVSPSVPIRQKIFLCPSADLPTPNYNYLLNDLLVGTAGKMRFTQIKHPSQKILLFEQDGPDDGHFRLGLHSGDGDHPATRHFRKGTNGKGNYGFADSHVETLDPNFLWQHQQQVFELWY